MEASFILTKSNEGLLFVHSPLIEYADVVWDNCPQYLKEKLDKIQSEAARIVTGCTKLVFLNDLAKEAGWE